MYIQMLCVIAALTTPMSGMLPIRDIQIYTNTENVRHIAAGKNFVAFATSGGIRIYIRASKEWNTLTTNDHLPTNDVQNVAFDPDHPDALWMWGMIGAYEGWNSPERQVVLASVDLKTNSIRYVTHDLSTYNEISPLPYFMPNDFIVGRNQIHISITGCSNLTYDRAKKTWMPTQSSLPVNQWDMQYMYGFGPFKLMETETRILLIGRNGVIVSDKRNNIFKFYPLQGERYNSPMVFASSYPFDLKVLPTYIVYHVILQNTQWNLLNYPITSSKLSTCELNLETGKSKTIRTVPLSNQQIREIAGKAGDAYRDYLHGGTPMDIALDGKTIWFATYNLPGIHASGVTWFDTETKKWGSAPTDHGLAANMVYQIARYKGDIYAITTNGASKYDRVNNHWVIPGVNDIKSGESENSGDWQDIMDTRQTYGYVSAPKGYDTYNTFSGYLQILEHEGNLYDWVRWHPKGERTRWAVGRYDRTTHTIQPYDTLGDLKSISVGSMLLDGNDVWLMGGVKPDGTNQGDYTQPAVLKWNRQTNQFHLYTGKPFDMVSSIAQTDPIPRPFFFMVARNIWIWVPFQYKLVHYIAKSDEWRLVSADARKIYRFQSTNSLWVRTSSGSLFRWDDQNNWRKLILPNENDYKPYLGGSILEGNYYLWLGRIGLLRINRNLIHFEPGTP